MCSYIHSGTTVVTGRITERESYETMTSIWTTTRAERAPTAFFDDGSPGTHTITYSLPVPTTETHTLTSPTVYYPAVIASWHGSDRWTLSPQPPHITLGQKLETWIPEPRFYGGTSQKPEEVNLVTVLVPLLLGLGFVAAVFVWRIFRAKEKKKRVKYQRLADVELEDRRMR